MRMFPFLLFPAMALVAQAPSRVDLVQLFNTELPGINQLLKELKTQEAMTKAQGLLPAEAPRFDGSTMPSLAQSVDDTRGMGALYGLFAKTASAAGRWETAVEIQEKRAQGARASLIEFDKAAIATQWKKAAQDSRDYVTKNEPLKKELEIKIAAFKAEFEDIKATKKKLTKDESTAFNARGAKIQQDEQELAQIAAALPIHQKNLVNAPKVFKLLADDRKELEGMIKTASEAAAKAQKAIANQNDEITQFNTQQIIKKVKIVGKKNWVDAVLRAPENITKQGAPEDQAAFLNRLLVLDPGNALAQKALDNLKAGKDAFAKAAKPGKKVGAKKS
jgi:hypothetical protein